MDIEKQLEKIGKALQLIDVTIDRIFILIASAFGAWLTWTVLGAFEIGLLFRLGGAVLGAFVFAVAMWLFWSIAKFFA